VLGLRPLANGFNSSDTEAVLHIHRMISGLAISQGSLIVQHGERVAHKALSSVDLC
jgi:hypothetical protein